MTERERARQILTELRALAPGVLDAAAAHASGRDAEQLAAVRAALSADDPESALVAVLPTLSPPASREGVIAGLIEQAKAASAQVEQLDATVLATKARRDLAFVGHTIKAHVTDRSLATILQQALDLLGEDGPFAAVKATVAAARDAEQLLAMFAAGQPDADTVARNVASLRDAKATLGAQREKLQKLPQVIAAARTFAAEKGNLDADARLAIAEAVLCDRLAGSDERWRVAFERALAAENVGLARAAARRVEFYAVATGAAQPILDTAERLARLAAATGDVDTQLEALGDQALMLARRDSAAAVGLTEQLRSVAGDDPLRLLRAAFVTGQVHELIGDGATARSTFRRVMRVGADVEGAAHLLGWTALHLGRLEAGHGQTFQARQNLEFAEQVGRAANDDALVELAVDARKQLPT